MSGIGGFKGVSADQDARFSNKQKKLMKSMKFPKELELKVQPAKVNWLVMLEWVAKRVTELLGVEDEVLIHFIHNKLQGDKLVDPRELHIDLVPFLEKNTSLFMKELWSMLASASTTSSGIPQKLLDEKAEELRKKKEIQDKKNREAFRLERERAREGMKPPDNMDLDIRRRYGGRVSGGIEPGRSRPSRWGQERIRAKGRSRSRSRGRSRSRSRSRSPRRHPIRVSSPGGPKSPRSRSPMFRKRGRPASKQRRDGSRSPQPKRADNRSISSPSDGPQNGDKILKPDDKSQPKGDDMGGTDEKKRDEASKGDDRAKSPRSPDVRSPSPGSPVRRDSLAHGGGRRPRSKSSDRSLSPRRRHSHRPPRAASPVSRRDQGRRRNGYRSRDNDFRSKHGGGYGDSNRKGGRPFSSYGSRYEGSRYRTGHGADYRSSFRRHRDGPYRVEPRRHNEGAAHFSERGDRREYPPPLKGGHDGKGREEDNAPQGRPGTRERRGAEYAYKAGSPAGLKSQVEVPEKGTSPSPSSNVGAPKSGQKHGESPHLESRKQNPEGSPEKSGSLNDGEEDAKRSKRKREKKDKKSKRNKKHKKSKKHKKKVQRASSPSTSSGFSDRGRAEDKRIEELRKRALESMGKQTE